MSHTVWCFHRTSISQDKLIKITDVRLRLTPNTWASCFYPTNYGMVGMHYHSGHSILFCYDAVTSFANLRDWIIFASSSNTCSVISRVLGLLIVNSAVLACLQLFSTSLRPFSLALFWHVCSCPPLPCVHYYPSIVTRPTIVFRVFFKNWVPSLQRK